MPSLQKQYDTEQANLRYWDDKVEQYSARYRGAVEYYNQCVQDQRSSKTIKKAQKEIDKWRGNIDESRVKMESCQRRISAILRDFPREGHVQQATGLPAEIASRIVAIEHQDRSHANRYGR
ncbi:hypothetical protein F4778DRAFT_726295 [Xylariomycetidae sp. FL2044]|nr:hypothetical protein F4778DRAFT_726295 [Xylariomycetidae sp. FL2044]